MWITNKACLDRSKVSLLILVIPKFFYIFLNFLAKKKNLNATNNILVYMSIFYKPIRDHWGMLVFENSRKISKANDNSTDLNFKREEFEALRDKLLFCKWDDIFFLSQHLWFWLQKLCIRSILYIRVHIAYNQRIPDEI